MDSKPETNAPAADANRRFAEAPCYAATFSQSHGRLIFEKHSDRIDIHDPDNAWKDWYSLTTTQAHDLKCWLERMLAA